MADSDGKKGSWAPTRGYFQVTGGGGGGAKPAPAKKKAAPAEEPAADADAEAAEEAAPAASGEGSKAWAPTRGHFLVAGGKGGGAKKPAAKKAAPKKTEAAPVADAGGEPATAASAAPKPAARAAAPKPAAKAAPTAPKTDPLRDSVTTVPALVEAPVARSIEAQLYDAPDSETTLYKVSALNVAFALTSLILLVYTVLVVWQDYDKDWKTIQSTWREEVAANFSTELEAARKKQSEEFLAIEPTLAAIIQHVGGEQALSEARSAAALAGPAGAAPWMDATLGGARQVLDKSANFAELRQKRQVLKEAEKNYTLGDEALRALKGDYAAAKFQHEEELRHIADHHGDTPEGKRLSDAAKRHFVTDWGLRVETKEAEVSNLLGKARAAKADLDELLASSTRVTVGEKSMSLPEVEAKLEEVTRAVTASKKNLDRVETNWRNFVRNMPFLDFLAPSYTIEKVVLPEIKEDLNFEKYARIDRCKTCHVNIDNPDIAVDRANLQPHKDWGAVFQSHPRLDLFVGSASPHPYQQFGCTICHWGDGHATDFITAAHTPANREQKEEWEHKYGWEPLHHQDYPMYRRDLVYASCQKCHHEEHSLIGGKTFNLGFEVVKSYGCYGCHNLEAFKGYDKVGPSLLHVADKTTPEFLYKWVRNPTHFRPTTRMPRFFDLTNSSGTMVIEDNRGDQAQVFERDFNVRNGVEALAIATYLSKTSQPRAEAVRPLQAQGDPGRGRELFRVSGCLGCHSVKAESMTPELKAKDPAAEVRGAIAGLTAAVAALPPAAAEKVQKRTAVSGAATDALNALATWFERLSVGKNVDALYSDVLAPLEELANAEETLAADGGPIAAARAAAGVIYDRWVHNTFAPDLSAIGSKARPEWLADWIADPQKHDAGTTMPRLRLEEGENGQQNLADMVAYLMTLRDPSFESREVFALSSPEAQAVLDEIYFDYMHRLKTRAETAQLVATQTTEQKLQLVGHRLIRRYGCFGCHNGITDLEAAGEDKTFDKAQQIGTDLEGWGIKLSAFLDYGHWGHQHSGREAIGHDRYAWARAKLTDTRRFDVLPAEKQVSEDEYVYEPTNRMIQKSPEELLKMPLFGFASDPEQVNAAVTILAGLVKDDVAPQRKHILKGDKKTLEDGSRLIAKLNCMGCHRVGAEQQDVLAARLPSFSLAGGSEDDTRRNELEKETWLARGLTLQGNREKARELDEKAKETLGLKLPKGTLLNRQVFDSTTMLPDVHQAVSVVELARGPEDQENKIAGHFAAASVAPGARYLPVAGYEEGRIRFYFGSGVDQRPQAPPPLVRQGERVRSDWFFKFLLNVETIRSWLKVRMPSFYLDDDEARLIVAWFKANATVPGAGPRPSGPPIAIPDPLARLPGAAQSVPVASERFAADRFNAEQANQGKFLFGAGSPPDKPGLQCNGCHPAGALLPTVPILNPSDRFDFKSLVVRQPELETAVPDDSYSILVEEPGGKVRVLPGFQDAAAAQAHADANLKGRKLAIADPWSKASWGPDLGKASARLRPDWIREWLMAPPSFMPGTKMPSFFGEQSPAFQTKQGAWHFNQVDFRAADASERIEALIQYLVHMSRAEGVARAGD